MALSELSCEHRADGDDYGVERIEQTAIGGRWRFGNWERIAGSMWRRERGRDGDIKWGADARSWRGSEI